MKWIILLALLLPSLAMAQDQVLAPNAEAHSANWNHDNQGTSCTGSDCFVEIDEASGSPDGLEINTVISGAIYVGDFPTPSSSPSTDTDAQTFVLVSSSCNAAGEEDDGGTNPNFSLNVNCNGVDVLTLATATTIVGLDQVNSYDFTFDDVQCAADGSDLAMRFLAGQAGGGGNRRWGCIEAMEWEVTHGAGGGGDQRRRPFVIQ